jgi:hypothetical protein
MTEGASFVPPDRQLPVVKEQLAKQKDLLRRVERLMLHSRQSLGLNPIDLFLNRLNLSLGGGRNTYPGAGPIPGFRTQRQRDAKPGDCSGNVQCCLSHRESLLLE